MRRRSQRGDGSAHRSCRSSRLAVAPRRFRFCCVCRPRIHWLTGPVPRPVVARIIVGFPGAPGRAAGVNSRTRRGCAVSSSCPAADRRVRTRWPALEREIAELGAHLRVGARLPGRRPVVADSGWARHGRVARGVAPSSPLRAGTHLEARWCRCRVGGPALDRRPSYCRGRGCNALQPARRASAGSGWPRLARELCRALRAVIAPVLPRH